jgi:hypothetical protein
MDNFLSEEDEAILANTLAEYKVSPKEWWRFWSWDELQLDGNFKLCELQALVRAMERMAERHTGEED